MQEDSETARAIEKPPEQILWCCPGCGHRQVFPIPDAETVRGYYDYKTVSGNGIRSAARWRGGKDKATKTYTRRLSSRVGSL